ncbi:hypothetical protein LINPERHAP1_LOCUS17310 [Linum perenne]
MQLCF